MVARHLQTRRLVDESDAGRRHGAGRQRRQDARHHDGHRVESVPRIIRVIIPSNVLLTLPPQ